MSFGINPIPDIPLGFNIIAPFSSINPLDGQGGGAAGIEDIIIGTRYRYDLEGLKSLWGKEGNYVMGMGAVEIPNGVIDHEAFQGPLDSMGALMFSLEYEQFSLLNYFKDTAIGKIDPMTGGRGLLLHPTVVYAPGWNGLQFFAVVSLPIWQAYENPSDQDRFRIGTGVIYNF